MGEEEEEAEDAAQEEEEGVEARRQRHSGGRGDGDAICVFCVYLSLYTLCFRMRPL